MQTSMTFRHMIGHILHNSNAYHLQRNAQMPRNATDSIHFFRQRNFKSSRVSITGSSIAYSVKQSFELFVNDKGSNIIARCASTRLTILQTSKMEIAFTTTALCLMRSKKCTKFSTKEFVLRTRSLKKFIAT